MKLKQMWMSLCIACCLIPISGCSQIWKVTSNSTGNKYILINELGTSQKSLLSIGMKKDNAIKCLKKHHIPYSDQKKEENTEIINYGAASYLLFDNDSLEGISLSTDANLKNIREYRTAAGLKIGDNENTVKKLYGTNYKDETQDKEPSYLYHINNLYLKVDFSESQHVTDWWVTTYNTDVSEDIS